MLLLLYKRGELANVSVATLLIGPEQPLALWTAYSSPFGTAHLAKSLQPLHLSQVRQAPAEKATPARNTFSWLKKSPLKDIELVSKSMSICLFPLQLTIIGELQPEGDYDISVEIMVMRDKTGLEQ